MSRETGRTIAIVASPGAAQTVKQGVRRAGVPTAEIEVAEFVVESRVERKVAPAAPDLSHLRQVAIGATAGLAGWLTAASFLPEVSADTMVYGGVGGAALGAVCGACAWMLRHAPPEVNVQRRFWKLRVADGSPNAARARGIASRTGRTLHRLVTGAFEVPPKP